MLLTWRRRDIKGARNKSIDRSQQLPPYLPASNISKLHMRPKSNCSNIIPSVFRGKRNSKIRISLKGVMHSEERLRYSTPTPFLKDKNSTWLSEKPKNMSVIKKGTGKHSRKRSKTKLSLIDKSDIAKIQKSKRIAMSSLGRNAKIWKKRKESQSKYVTNSELFKTADCKYTTDSVTVAHSPSLYDSRKYITNSLTRYDLSHLTLSQPKSALGLHDYTTGFSSAKKLTVMSTKSKNSKSKNKSKHFKLLKKRNLNSKISKELKFTDLTRFSPNKSRLIIRKTNGPTLSKSRYDA